MVRTIKPLGMPLLQRRFKRDVKKMPAQTRLEVCSPEGMPQGPVWVRFYVKEIFEETGVRRNARESFAQVNEDGDLEDGVRV